jgi:hypothetical protein
MDFEYRENAGHAHHALEQRQEREEANRAATVRRVLQKKLGEDTNTPQTTPPTMHTQSGKPSIVYQASDSPSGQPAPYSQEEWTRMQKAYDLGREQEREKQEEERRRAREEQGAKGHGGARAEPDTRRGGPTYTNAPGYGGAYPFHKGYEQT